MVIHPCPDDKGHPVTIKFPSSPTTLFAWLDPGQAATVVPEGPVPHELNGIPLLPWRQLPANREEWTHLAQEMTFDEPTFIVPKHKTPAAGAVVVEPDGRVWLVSPTNDYGGYKQTFAKGTVKHLSLKATALKEVFEKSGLRVELMAHLIDITKTNSHTRYYLAHRIGGTPSAMGWKSQAAHLVPLELVKELLNMRVDHPIVDRLMEVWGAWAGRFQEQLEPLPTALRRRPSRAIQPDPTHPVPASASKYASQDADAIASLACAAINAKQKSEAIKYCKLAALVFHHQGKSGLAQFFVKFVHEATAKEKEVELPAPPSQLGELDPSPSISTIRRQWMSKEFPIFEVQAHFIARLIMDLEAACLRVYRLRSIQDVCFRFEMVPMPWDIPEYMRFITGCMACGFVCGDLGVDDWLDLNEIHRHPVEAIGRLNSGEIRLYIHTLQRAEKWADCYGSPVLESLASGALQAIAKRLFEDESLYEPY